MSLNEDVDLEEFVMTKDDLSGADIKAVCTEAGLLALRERRMRVTKADFTTAREKVCIFTIGFLQLIIIFNRFFTGRMKAHLRGFICNLYICSFGIFIVFPPDNAADELPLGDIHTARPTESQVPSSWNDNYIKLT